MAESTSDCQLPADFWVTRGIQSDTFRSMTANFVRSIFCLLILNFIHCPSQTGQFPQKAGRISFSFSVIFTCNCQQVFLACWVYIYKYQTDCTFFSLRSIRNLGVVCRIFSCNHQVKLVEQLKRLISVFLIPKLKGSIPKHMQKNTVISSNI